MDFVWEIFPEGFSSSCTRASRYVTFPRSRYRPGLSKSRNRDTRGARRLPARFYRNFIRSRKRPANISIAAIDRSFPSRRYAAFRANLLRRPSRPSFFSIWSTTVINNPANITLSAIKIRRIFKVIHWRTRNIYVYAFLHFYIFQHFFFFC